MVALDGSESADKALDFAFDLAAKYSAEIVLLSVVPPVTTPMSPDSLEVPVSLEVLNQHLEELIASHKKVLSEALRKSEKIKPDLSVSTKLVKGRRPSESIVETAKEGKFDIIVMGSRGLGGIKEFFLGSVSDRVADEAVCPVLIVK